MFDMRCPYCDLRIPTENRRLAEHSDPIGKRCAAGGLPKDPLHGLIAEVQFLHEADATHKRGWRLSDRSDQDALLHAIEELTEVGRATTPEEVTSELGDALGCLVHFAIKAGVSLDDAAWSALRKLSADFPEEA